MQTKQRINVLEPINALELLQLLIICFKLAVAEFNERTSIVAAPPGVKRRGAVCLPPADEVLHTPRQANPPKLSTDDL